MPFVEEMLYKGYALTARSLQLRDSGKWSLAVYIRKNNAVRPFSASNTFDTQEEAIGRSLHFGRDIIDEKVSGCSVDDL